MNENLFNHINIHKSNTYFPNPSLVGDKYQQLINSYTGIDLAILGVGVNGHIAFNEPGTLITATTHIVNLTESSRLANARFFDNDINNVPKQAVSVGLKEILHAKKILLVATGEAKKPAINHLKQTQDFDQQWPITALHKHHDVLVFTDFK
jgi:glucosamine-6-phosphate deaminase